jgi:glycosyltransferase involved in cell wall biosynthesis
MKISVVIPAHNEEKFIKEVIKAVLAQDYPDFELIVVDNVSSDNTSLYAKEFPIQVVREDRKGTQYARECGRKIAKGEIIAYLDADCLPEKSWLTVGASAFNDPKVVAVTGPYNYFDASYLFNKFSLIFQKVFYFYANIILQYFHKGAVLIGGNMLIRSSTLQKIGGLNTSIVFYGDDTDTAKRLSSVGKISFLKNLLMPTSARRFHGEGIIKVGWLYIINFFSILFRGKPTQDKYTSVK